MKPLLPLVLAIVCILSCSSPVPNDSKDSSPNSLVRIDQPPTILSLTAERDTMSIEDSVRFTCRAEDPDGDSLDYEWIAVKTNEDGSVDVTYYSCFGFDTTQFVANRNEAVWRAPRWPGTYTVFCKVTDSAGYEEMAEAPVTVTLSDQVYGVTEKYHYLIDEPIHFTVGNNLYSQVEVMNCAFNVLSITEKYEEDGWHTIISLWCMAIGTPIPIEYQESVRDSIPYYLSESGLYRLKFQVRVDSSKEFEDLLSNEFFVE